MEDIKKTPQETQQETGEQITPAQIGDSSPLQAGEDNPGQRGEYIQKEGYRIKPGENGEPDKIIINVPPYNPKLDPKSPEFDEALWKEEFRKIDFSGISEIFKEQQHSLIEAAKQLYTPERINQIVDTLQDSVSDVVSTMENLIGMGFLRKACENFLKLVEELPPEELEALQEEIKAEEEPEEDENQASLFDEQALFIDEEGEPPPDAGTLPDGTKLIYSGLKFTAEGTQHKAKKPRRTPKLDAITEQAVNITAKGYILQGKVTNALTKLKPTKKNTSIDPITGKAIFKFGNILTVTMTHYRDIADPRTSTFQLLDAMTETLTESGSKNETVYLPLTTYMEKRGLKDRKETRKQVEEDLDILYNASANVKEHRSGKELNFLDMRICEAKGIRNGIIYFSFGKTFFSLLKGYAVMYYPEPLYKINGKRNPYSYTLGRKIAEHKNMNAGKKNENIIAVKTLLKVCEGLPTKKEVAETNRNYTDRIIKPFERDLDALEDILTWEYCHRNGTPLTPEELETFSFETFESSLILTHWKDYPDQTKRLADRQARIDEAKEAGKKKKRGRPPKPKQET